MFSPSIWVLRALGRGAPQGLVHNVLRQFSLSPAQRYMIFQTCFFLLLCHNDQTSYVKDVSGPFFVNFTLLGFWVGMGGLPRDNCTTCFGSFPHSTAQTWKL